MSVEADATASSVQAAMLEHVWTAPICSGKLGHECTHSVCHRAVTDGVPASEQSTMDS